MLAFKPIISHSNGSTYRYQFVHESDSVDQLYDDVVIVSKIGDKNIIPLKRNCCQSQTASNLSPQTSP